MYHLVSALKFTALKIKEAMVSNCCMSGTLDCSLLQEVPGPQTVVCGMKPLWTDYKKYMIYCSRTFDHKECQCPLMSIGEKYIIHSLKYEDFRHKKW